AAMTGVHGVFSVQPGVLGAAPVPYDDEIAWGCAIADAALAAGAAHLVFSSVAGAPRSEGVRAFEPKLRIERHLHRIGAPATILRPVSFMDNYADPAFGLGSGALATPFAADVPEQLIALADIGVFAALAFDDPAGYLGQAVDIAGDELTPPRIAQALSQALGRAVPYLPVPLEAVRAQSTAYAEAVDFLNREGGYGADLARARELHPGLLTFDRWLATGGAARIATLIPAEQLSS
ncbi:NmrA family NAD(P)-binding protein, partial [Nonomuraea sp. NPDC049784]|uniref:NmrA family NAD(P)-binding protein n=1 Tax=Nonomuraea sp. NPDC049784 TaxID=3154361 RepID=UPI0033D2F4C1